MLTNYAVPLYHQSLRAIFSGYIQTYEHLLGSMEITYYFSHRGMKLFNQRRYREDLFFCGYLRVFLKIDDLYVAAVFQIFVANVPKICYCVLRCLTLTCDV